MKRKNMKQFLGTISLLTAVALVLAACSGAPEQLTVMTAKAEQGTINATFDITGALVPAQAADLAAPFAGRVSEIKVKPGDLVTQGQILGSLDTTQLQGQLRQAQANYQGSQSSQAQARVGLDNAKSALERSRTLFAEGAVSKQQLDADQKTYDLAKLQYESSSTANANAANASVESIRAQINNASIKSPFAGVVVSIGVTVGETASSAVPMFTVADMSSLKLKGTVPQQALPFLQKDDPVEVLVDIYAEKPYHATVTDIGTMSVSTGTYFPVEVSFLNTDQIASGLSAHASIMATGRSHVLVPLEAVVENNGDSYVFLIKDGIATKQAVVTGLFDQKQIEIIQGLAVGEEVAITNANHLFDQMPVKVVAQ